MNVRMCTLVFSADAHDANESKFTCLHEEEEAFKLKNYRQGKTYNLETKLRLYG